MLSVQRDDCTVTHEDGAIISLSKACMLGISVSYIATNLCSYAHTPFALLVPALEVVAVAVKM